MLLISTILLAFTVGHVYSSLTLMSGSGVLIPLNAVKFLANTTDSILMSEMVLFFRNPFPENFSQVLLTYPIDHRAAVYDMRICIGTKELVAKVKDKNEAQKNYEDAIASGHGAYLSSWDDDQTDVYKISIGNVPPNEKIVITIKYVVELILESAHSLRLGIPLGLFERYTPTSLNRRVDSSTQVSDIPVSVKINLHMSQPVASVSSPTNALYKVTFGEQLQGRYDAIITSETTCKVAEYVLIIEFAEKLTSILYVEQLQDHLSTTMTMVSIIPNLTEKFIKQQLSEIIFLVDRSGSMSGAYIEKAKETLLSAINMLPENCMFQIIGFGSHFESLFSEGPVALSLQSKKIALQYAQEMEADFGGTEVLEALRHISQLSRSDLPRNVIFMTDGGVTNTYEVIAQVRRDHINTGTRYFSFGIGSGASRGLVEGSASNGGGYHEMIDDTDAKAGMISDKVTRQIFRILSPALCKVNLQWGLGIMKNLQVNESSMPWKQTPSVIPAILHNSKQTVFVEFSGRLDKNLFTYSGLKLQSSSDNKAGGSAKVFSLFDSYNDTFKRGIDVLTISGKLPDYDYNHNVGMIKIIDSNTIRTFVARHILRELEVEFDTSLDSLKRNELKQTAIHISTTYGVVCKWTAHIAIEVREGQLLEESKIKPMITQPITLSRESHNQYIGMSFGATSKKNIWSTKLGAIIPKPNDATSKQAREELPVFKPEPDYQHVMLEADDATSKHAHASETRETRPAHKFEMKEYLIANRYYSVILSQESFYSKLMLGLSSCLILVVIISIFKCWSSKHRDTKQKKSD